MLIAILVPMLPLQCPRSAPGNSSKHGDPKLDGRRGPPRRATSWSEWDRDLHIHLPCRWRIMSDAFFELLSRVGGAALVRATTGLALCLALAAVSRKGTGGVLPAVAVIYSMLGTLMFKSRPQSREAQEPFRGSEPLCARARPLLRELCVGGGFGFCSSGWVSLFCGQAAEGS